MVLILFKIHVIDENKKINARIVGGKNTAVL